MICVYSYVDFSAIVVASFIFGNWLYILSCFSHNDWEMNNSMQMRENKKKKQKKNKKRKKERKRIHNFLGQKRMETFLFVIHWPVEGNGFTDVPMHFSFDDHIYSH